MRRVALIFSLVATASASAQDSAFTRLRVGASALRIPVAGHIGDDWRPQTGAHAEIGSNVGRSQITFGIAHIAFQPLAARPAFTQTMFSLDWRAPVLRRSRFELGAGARITNVRFDFDDPELVAGLRTEEEILLSGAGRAAFHIGGGFRGFVDASYGVLMLSTKTPTAIASVGIDHDARMPAWLRGILR